MKQIQFREVASLKGQKIKATTPELFSENALVNR